MKTLCLILILCSICLLCAKANASDWVQYRSSALGDKMFYDRDSKDFESDNIVRVWVKEIFSEEGKEVFIEERMRTGLPTHDLDKLSYSLCQYKINCNTHEQDVLGCDRYTKDGNMIESYAIPKSLQHWQPTDLDSSMDLLRIAVCKQK